MEQERESEGGGSEPLSVCSWYFTLSECGSSRLAMDSKLSSSLCLFHPSRPALPPPADTAMNIRSHLYVDASSWTLTARGRLLMSPRAIMKVKSLLDNRGAAKWWKYSSAVIGYRVSKKSPFPTPAGLISAPGTLELFYRWCLMEISVERT